MHQFTDWTYTTTRFTVQLHIIFLRHPVFFMDSCSPIRSGEGASFAGVTKSSMLDFRRNDLKSELKFATSWVYCMNAAECEALLMRKSTMTRCDRLFVPGGMEGGKEERVARGGTVEKAAWFHRLSGLVIDER